MKAIPIDNYEMMNKLLRFYSILKLQRGCEVGVREGYFSEFLLMNNPNLSMVLVDPYEAYQDWSTYYDLQYQNVTKQEAQLRLSKFSQRATFVFEPSVKGATHFPSGYFDFVYIDAAHTYKNAFEDCDAWISKIQSQGILCGHDYSMPEVAKAVQEVARKYGKTIYNSSVELGNSWWIPIK